MRAWQRRGMLACLLLPVAVVFFLLVMLRRMLYRIGVLRSARLPVPVVVVGNIFVGGTGKTPFTIWLVQALRALGMVPGVVSRGYGATRRDTMIVTPKSSAAQAGDEPLLIARQARCPVVVGRSRVAAPHALLAAFPEVNLIVADDGLQHYALERDVEIVVGDGRGNGNGWMLPAGPLREPASRRRDFTVFNLPDGVEDAASPAYTMRVRGHYALRLGNRHDTQPLTTLAAGRRRIAAAAGIGNPQRFFDMLRTLGLSLVAELALPDHYDYAQDPFVSVDADVILITEKDAVKCLQIESIRNDPRLWVVPVSAQIDSALAHRIVEKCRGLPTA